MISIAENQQLAVSDWRSQTIICNVGSEGSSPHCTTSLGPLPPIMHLAIGNNDDNNNNLTFLTCGDKQLKFWSLSGRNLNSSKVLLDNKGKIQHYFSVVEVKGYFLVGCDDGCIYVIGSNGQKVLSSFPYRKMTDDTKKDEKNTINSIKKGSKNDNNQKDSKLKSKGNTAISSLFVHKQNERKYYLFIGCKDGSINIYDASNISNSQLNPIFIYCFEIHNLNANNILLSQVQSITIYNNNIINNNHNTATTGNSGKNKKKSDDDDDVFLLCLSTRSCDILEVIVNLDILSKSATLYKASLSSSLSSSSSLLSPKNNDLSCGIIIQSHFIDELWGISTHPLLPYYCTVGDDKTLRFYNIHQRAMIRCVNLGLIARTCCYNMDGEYIAIGFGGRLGKGKEKGGGILYLMRCR